MSQHSPRRFLSGVVCPHCGESDSIRVYTVDEMPWRDCIACGVEENLSDSTVSNATVDSQAWRSEVEASEVSIVRFVKARPPPTDS